MNAGLELSTITIEQSPIWWWSSECKALCREFNRAYDAWAARRHQQRLTVRQAMHVHVLNAMGARRVAQREITPHVKPVAPPPTAADRYAAWKEKEGL